MNKFNLVIDKNITVDGKLTVTVSEGDTIIATFIEGIRYDGNGVLKEYLDQINKSMGENIDLVSDDRAVPSISLYLNSTESSNAILLLDLGIRELHEFGPGVDLMYFNKNSVKYIERFVHNLSRLGRFIKEVREVFVTCANNMEK